LAIPSTMHDGARVICFTAIDERHRHTDFCRHFVDGRLAVPASGLVICQYPGETGYFLFGCNADWETVTDTWHATLEEAKQQAEFEYEGVSATWQLPPE